MQHITAHHPEIAGIDVGRDVAEGMTNVESLTRGVGEHVLHEELVVRHRGTIRWGQRADRVGHVERP
ncbi:Uncharacterised protein [Mycobacterium tuberculosis]|uniref:Uncharacterized protein n=1 Tax=Mycobacterium tuberculosis TaxID=1773 RepID=A0A0U0S094_MYCTX|nr:Uncharacterised protein [Mycobacterium tuberculosis]CKT11991.1 Uncharacterised protein [Mycobacterium tuberculosis]COV72152.1 Uncharacterised protein [Mycobacterium tuberculosis]COW36068.1 Uncharacterised protein [Mycobacterium tuberculosis]